MPQLKSLKTLKKICLKNIVQNMNSLWCADFTKTMLNQSHWMYVVGPFDSLPASVCHDIFVAMKRKSVLRKQHIYLLIHSSYTTLDCSEEKSETALILRLAGARCGQTLEKLILTRSSIHKKTFLSIFPSLAALKVLNLGHCADVDDAVLAVIGVYGCNLTDLDLSHTKVGDQGIAMLHEPRDENNTLNDRFGQCQKLQTFNILHTFVTDNGAKSALSALKSLVNFGYGNSAAVISELMEDAPDRQFDLVGLHFSGADMNDQVFQIAINACPNARLFYISTFRSMNDASLLPIAFCAGPVSEVHICNEEKNHSLNIAEAFFPILAQKGASLVSLNLAEVSRINVRLILEYCPQLLHLRLLLNDSYTNDLPHGVLLSKFDVASRLRTLNINCCWGNLDNQIGNSPPLQDMFALLKSPDLSEVDIVHCESLTSELISEVVGINSFTKLTSLAIISCHNLTLQPLLPILLGKNPLTKIFLLNCDLITRRDFEDYQKQLMLRGLSNVVHACWS